VSVSFAMILIFDFDWVTDYLSFLWYKSISIYLQKKVLTLYTTFTLGGFQRVIVGQEQEKGKLQEWELGTLKQFSGKK